MTDDEAFIRRIVDSPGDDLPRLVYADWLDERGDPRGAYLRAEVDCAKEWALPPFERERQAPPTPPQDLTAKLDSLWIARVSRPPFGVCCDHIRYHESGPPIFPTQLDHLQRHFGVELPCQYRAFLLNQNGGIPDANWLSLYCGGFDEEAHVYVTQFRAALTNHRAGELRRAEVVAWRTGHGTVRKYLIFADAASDRPDDVLILGLSGDEAGVVFNRYGSHNQPFNPSQLKEVSPTLSALLSTVQEDHNELYYRPFNLDE